MYPYMFILISYIELLFCKRTGETKIHFFTFIFCANTSSLIFHKNERKVHRLHAYLRKRVSDFKIRS